MEYETEEQQVEALKKWWKENSSLLIAGVAVGVIIVAGWRYYNEYKNTRAEFASQTYETIVQALPGVTDITELQVKANELYASYADTPYAALSALVLAKKQLQKGDTQQAMQQLDWVVNNAVQAELAHVARLRLARVLLATQQMDKALELINIDYPASFSALYEELKGDIYVAKGELDKARVAYDKAILSLGAQPSNWLKLKRDDLGEFDKAEPTT